MIECARKFYMALRSGPNGFWNPILDFFGKISMEFEWDICDFSRTNDIAPFESKL